MEIEALRKEIHSTVDQLEDEEVLKNLLRLLKIETVEPDFNFEYEKTQEFQHQIDKARKSLAEGKGIPHDVAMKSLQERWKQ